MSQVVTKLHEFTLTFVGEHELTDEVANALFEAGCDDSTPCSEGTKIYVHFHREADSLSDAVGSAIKDVTKAGFSVARVEVEPASE